MFIRKKSERRLSGACAAAIIPRQETKQGRFSAAEADGKAARPLPVIP